MLVVVNQPLINDFRIEGTLSSSFLDNLRKEFGDDMKIVKQDEDEGWIDVDDLDWFKEAVAKETPGSNLRFYRKLNGMTQKELAERCGVSRQTVNAIENDKYDPTLSLAFRLAKELQLTVDELFTPA